MVTWWESKSLSRRLMNYMPKQTRALMWFCWTLRYIYIYYIVMLQITSIFYKKMQVLHAVTRLMTRLLELNWIHCKTTDYLYSINNCSLKWNEIKSFSFNRFSISIHQIFCNVLKNWDCIPDLTLNSGLFWNNSSCWYEEAAQSWKIFIENPVYFFYI